MSVTQGDLNLFRPFLIAGIARIPIIFFVAMLIHLAGCTPLSYSLPFRYDVSVNVKSLDTIRANIRAKGAAPRCYDRKITNVKSLSSPPNPWFDSWKEKWTLDRCGQLIDYVLEFTPLPLKMGRMYIRIPSAYSTPIETLVDLRNFNEVVAIVYDAEKYKHPMTNPECKDRKISAAKILTPPKDFRTDSWIEEWIVDRCGSIVHIQMNITLDAIGGMRIYSQ